MTTIIKDDYTKLMAIVTKAEALGLLQHDKMSLLMDLEAAYKQFNLRLDDLLTADTADFSHDINGIQANINRQTKVIENDFEPRFSGNYSDNAKVAPKKRTVQERD